MFTLWHSIGVRPCVYLGVLIDAFVYDGRGHTLTTLWTLTQADFHGDWPYETLLESHLFKEFTMCPDLSWSLREKLSVCHVTWLQSSETEQKRQIHFRWSQIYKETSPTTRQALHKGAVRGARHWHLRTCQHSITFPPQGGDLVPLSSKEEWQHPSTNKAPQMTSDIHRWCTVGMDRWMNGSTKHQTLTPVTTLHFPFPLPE